MKPDELPVVTALPARLSALVGRNGLNTRVMPTSWPPTVRMVPDPDPDVPPPAAPEHADTASTAVRASAAGTGHRLAFAPAFGDVLPIIFLSIMAPFGAMGGCRVLGRIPSSETSGPRRPRTCAAPAAC